MSDTSQGPGWWLASDGNWYAPEQHPDYVAPTPPPAPVPFAVVPPRSTAAPGATGSTAPATSAPGTSVGAGYGGQVLTLDRESPQSPPWRAGSKRPSMAPSTQRSFSSGPTRRDPGDSAATVSSQVPALRVFLVVGVVLSTLHLLTYFILRSAFENAVAFEAATSGRAHDLVLLSYALQALSVLNLVVFLALLLSRSFSTVRTLLGVFLIWSLLDVALGVVEHSSVAAGWALVTAVYVGVVFQSVGQARVSESFSEGGGHRYSRFERALAVYVIVLAVLSGVLTVHLYSAVGPSSSSSGIITYANGAGGTRQPGLDPSPSAYVAQTVTAHDFTVSLTFDPNSNATLDYHPSMTIDGRAEPGVDGVDIGGTLLHSSSQVLISVNREGAPGLIKMDPSSCEAPGETGVAPHLSFTATIMGQTTSVCGVNEAVLTFVNAGSFQYMVRFALPNQLGTPVATTMADLQAIANSITIR